MHQAAAIPQPAAVTKTVPKPTKPPPTPKILSREKQTMKKPSGLPKDQSLKSKQARVRWQIEYYFSDQNLVRDNYLRHCMDEEGWVPLAMLAKFPKVARESLDVIQVIDALADSSSVIMRAVVAQGEKPTKLEQVAGRVLVRKAADWQSWPLAGASYVPSTEQPRAAGTYQPGVPVSGSEAEALMVEQVLTQAEAAALAQLQAQIAQASAQAQARTATQMQAAAQAEVQPAAQVGA